MRLRTLTIMVGLSLGLLLVASVYLRQRPPGADGVVRVHFVDNISPAHEAVIEVFNQRHAGDIEIVPVDLPFEKFTTNERKELLARSLRSKSEKLDVFAVDRIWVPRFARWAEPLEPHIDLYARRDILPAALQSCYWQDTLVALPMYIDVGLMYYRSDIIRKLPDAARIEQRLQESISWEELSALRSRLGYRSRPFYIFQGKEYEGLICNFLEIAMSYDRSYLGQDGFGIEKPAALEALSHMVSLVRTGTSPPEVGEFDENDSYRFFLDTDGVFVRGWPNFIENFLTFYPDTAKLRSVGRAPLPHVKGSEPTSVFGGWNLMLSRSSKHKKQAAVFIEYLQSAEAQQILLERGGFIPTNVHLYVDSSVQRSHPELGFYHDLLQRGFDRPALVEYTKTSDVLSHYLNAAIVRRLEPATALRQAREAIESETVLIK